MTDATTRFSSADGTDVTISVHDIPDDADRTIIVLHEPFRSMAVTLTANDLLALAHGLLAIGRAKKGISHD